MTTRTIVGLGVALIVIGGAWYWMTGGRDGQNSTVPWPVAPDSKNATYRIDGRTVTLTNGRAETASVAGSATTVVIQYFGNEATGDLNGDGAPDTAFILTRSAGGSGTFYYVAAAIQSAGGYRGSDAVLLGDRIAPQTTEIKDGILIVNYADRKAGEPMTTPPSEGKSQYLKLDPITLQFGIVVQNFEGEANPAQLSLGMQTWTWIDTKYNNDTSVAPKKAGTFTITFKKGGTFSATTDCNSISGSYETSGNKITFTKMMSTMMYCEESQEREFAKELSEADSYLFTSKGELIFNLGFDSGTMTFR